MAKVEYAGDILKGMRDNQAVVIGSGSKEYVFWNYENGRKLIADYHSDMPNYYNVDSIVKNTITVIERSFEKEVKRKVAVDTVASHVFLLTIHRIKRDNNIIADKEVSNG